jgi:hypothetical protein
MLKSHIPFIRVSSALIRGYSVFSGFFNNLLNRFPVPRRFSFHGVLAMKAPLPLRWPEARPLQYASQDS